MTKQISKKTIISAVLIAVLLTVVVLIVVFLPKKTAKYIIVYKNDALVEVLDINKNTEKCYETDDGKYNVLVIENGRAYVKTANCDNQICVYTEAIFKEGQQILCSPHGYLFYAADRLDGVVVV